MATEYLLPIHQGYNPKNPYVFHHTTNNTSKRSQIKFNQTHTRIKAIHIWGEPLQNDKIEKKMNAELLAELKASSSESSPSSTPCHLSEHDKEASHLKDHQRKCLI